MIAILVSIAMTLFMGLNLFLVFYVFGTTVFYFSLLISSAIQLRTTYGLAQKAPYQELWESSFTPPVSILVPAFNESAGIVASVRSLLAINYPSYEVIVINDGSKDDTLNKMIQAFQMKPIKKQIYSRLDTNEVSTVFVSDIYSNLFVLDKVNGGKADALNAGINFSHFPYFCSLDADSVLERDAFLKIMKPIIDSSGEVIASGGSIRIANGCTIERGEVVHVDLPKNKLAIMQVIEYLRAFLMGRVGLSRHNLLLIVSGAFGVFNKEMVITSGGYLRQSIGEDMELIVRLHRTIREQKLKNRIIYIPDPVCWTEAPEDISVLRKQRSRWHRGLLDSLWKHRIMFFNPRYGGIGLIAYPYFFFVELFGPVIEILGYISLTVGFIVGDVFLPVACILFLFSILNGSILSTGAVLLEEWSLRRYPKVSHITKLCLFALTETFWYRPLNLFWRLEGFWHYFRKNHSWGEMTRKGVSQ